MRLDPPPREEAPSIWRLLIETAVQRKSENIIPNLAGEWLRAVLTGAPYPLTLLSTLLMRLRADHDVNGLRAGLLKAVLIRNFAMEVPVSLDPENRDPGYLLGCLFAAYEYAQKQALGGNVNATIRDQYYGTASATPRAVFPLLQQGHTPPVSPAQGQARSCDKCRSKDRRNLRTCRTGSSIRANPERVAPDAIRHRLLPSEKRFLPPQRWCGL
jgi:CRISPR-associated protein Csd1